VFWGEILCDGKMGLKRHAADIFQLKTSDLRSLPAAQGCASGTERWDRNFELVRWAFILAPMKYATMMHSSAVPFSMRRRHSFFSTRRRDHADVCRLTGGRGGRSEVGDAALYNLGDSSYVASENGVITALPTAP
jgi:hypothetical protein